MQSMPDAVLAPADGDTTYLFTLTIASGVLPVRISDGEGEHAVTWRMEPNAPPSYTLMDQPEGRKGP